MANVIEVEGLCKEYPAFALKHASFCVPEGICCGFVGANGAGKTTVLKLIAGMAFPDSGEIRLFGKPNQNAELREDIGILFDRPYFQEDWTALDIERVLRGFYQKWDSEEYRRHLSFFELNPKKKFKYFSRGMQIKLAMAVHLSHHARLLLLDEPTSGLDPVAREELLSLMREYLVEENRTILFSTHITSDLERIADYMVHIRQGSIVYSGSMEGFVSSYCAVRGVRIPEEKRKCAIGLREHSNGYECLMALEDIGGLPSDTITERATIDEIVVFLERGLSKC